MANLPTSIYLLPIYTFFLCVCVCWGGGVLAFVLKYHEVFSQYHSLQRPNKFFAHWRNIRSVFCLFIFYSVQHTLYKSRVNYS